MVKTPVFEKPAIISSEEIIPVAMNMVAELKRMIPGLNIPARNAMRI